MVNNAFYFLLGILIFAFIGCNPALQKEENIDNTEDNIENSQTVYICGDSISEDIADQITNYEDMSYGWAKRVTKIYKSKGGCYYFVNIGNSNGELDHLECTFLIEEWRGGPYRYTKYNFQLDGKDSILSTFKYNSDYSEENIVCISTTKVNNSTKYFFNRFYASCGNFACSVEENPFSKSELSLLKDVKNYEDFLKAIKKNK